MFWRINSASFLLIFILSCTADQSEKQQKAASKSSGYIINAEDFLRKYRQPYFKIIDLRKGDSYVSEHIAGALHIQRADISDSTYPYGGMMAGKEQLQRLFSELGISVEDTLVLYDDVGSCEATRLWWILQQFGFEQIKILDGGMDAWKKINGPVSEEVPEIVPTQFILGEFREKYHARKEDILEMMDQQGVLIDARMSDEYSGKILKKGASRAGHIPGSIHIDWAENIHYDGDRNFRHVDDLKAIYGNRGIRAEDPIIVYCHSGVRSSHTVFVLTQILGYENVRNYDGSWVEWSYISELPIELSE